MQKLFYFLETIIIIIWIIIIWSHRLELNAFFIFKLMATTIFSRFVTSSVISHNLRMASIVDLSARNPNWLLDRSELVSKNSYIRFANILLNNLPPSFREQIGL